MYKFYYEFDYYMELWAESFSYDLGLWFDMKESNYENDEKLFEIFLSDTDYELFRDPGI